MNKKKLYKSNNDYWFGGVCGGLAEHFDTDPTILRLGLIFTIIFFNYGILFYLVLFLFMPDKPIDKEKRRQIKSKGKKK